MIPKVTFRSGYPLVTSGLLDSNSPSPIDHHHGRKLPMNRTEARLASGLCISAERISAGLVDAWRRQSCEHSRYAILCLADFRDQQALLLAAATRGLLAPPVRRRAGRHDAEATGAHRQGNQGNEEVRSENLQSQSPPGVPRGQDPAAPPASLSRYVWIHTPSPSRQLLKSLLLVATTRPRTSPPPPFHLHPL